MANALGIDVSSHQGSNLDFQRIADSGVKFAFLRHSVGVEKDSTFDSNFQRAIQTPLLLGAYHYVWASASVKDQLNVFLEHDYAYMHLPPVLDFEQTNLTETNVALFLREVERLTSRVPIVYTRKNIWETIIPPANRDKYKNYFLWVAQYTDPTQGYPNLLPSTWTNWNFWQYTDAGRVPGHAGNVDLNYYNGSFEELCCQFDYPVPSSLRWPVDSPTVTQPFGNNPNYYGPLIGAEGLGHEGIDLRAPTGANVYACESGVVAVVGTTPSYGINVRIDHQDGLETTYAHLQQSLVSVGQRVERGQRIALADNTGASSGSHLHLNVKRKNATALRLTAYPNDLIDPTPLLVPPTSTEQPILLRPKAEVTLSLNIRSAPVVADNVIGRLAPNQTIMGYPKTGETWWKVIFNSAEAWMMSTWLEIVTEQYVAIRPKSTMTTTLNIRSGPGTNFSDVGDILPGEVLQGVPTAEAWWRVKSAAGIEGWAASEWLEVI